MRYGGSRRFVLGVATLLLVAAVLAGCTGRDGGESEEPPPDLPTTAAPTDADPGPGFDLEWKPLNGPPGGRVGLVAQDNHHPENIYLGSSRGLYRSTDHAETWQLLAEDGMEEITSIAFGTGGVYVCASGGLVVIESGGMSTSVDGPCLTVAAGDDHIYVSKSSEALGELRVELKRSQIGNGALDPESLEWQDVTPPYESMLDRAVPDTVVMGVDDLLVVGDSLIAGVALATGPMDANSLAAEVFVSIDRGGTWESVEIGFPDPIVPQKLVHDPDSGLVFALGHVNETDGPFFPLADLVRVSLDGGLNWEPLTERRDVGTPTVGDVDVLDDRYVLSNVDFSVIELDRTNPDEILRRYRPAVEGYSLGYTIKELIFDPTATGVVYSKPYLDHEGVARSLDNGETWVASHEGIIAAPTGNINVHPTDPNVMVASGNLGYVPHLTSDGGESWEPLAGTASMADEFAFDPHDPAHLLFMTEGSQFFESMDGGAAWAEVGNGFTANRVHSLSLSADGDVLFASNLGVNVSSITGIRPDDDVPIGHGENAWANMDYSPDYAYAVESAPDGTLFASYSPKKFEDHAAVWRYRGDPEGDPAGWVEVLRVPGASGVTDLVVGPGSPWTVYAGVAGPAAGVWSSEDGGDTWSRVHDNSFNFVTVHAVAADPSEPDTVYAAPWGAGLFRSTDSGMTWTEIDVPTVSVAAVVVDPAESRHLYVGDRIRPVVWESFDGGLTWGPLIEFDDALHYRVMALGLAEDGLYVSLLDRVEDGLAVFVGAPESGSTFRLDAEGPHRIDGLERSVLSFASNSGITYAVTHLSGVYEIRGDEAVDLSSGLPDMGFTHVLVDGDELFVSGGADVDLQLRSRIGDPAIVHNIYRKVASGGWEPLLEGDPFGSPIKKLVLHPENAEIMYAATGAGVYMSTDRGVTWSEENDGLAATDIGAIAVTDGYLVVGTLGGGAATGEIAPDGAVTWLSSGGPIVEIANVRLAVHQTHADRLWASSYPGGVFRSVDGGRTWIESNFGLPSFEVADPLLQGYYSLVVDPTDPDRVFLSIFEHGVFVSDTGAATWRPLGTYGSDVMRADLTSLVVDGQDPERLWLGTSDRGVFTSRDQGGTWQSVNDGLATAEILTLETSPSGAVFAGTAGYGVYMLEVGERTWNHLGRPIGTGEWSAWDRRLYQYGSFLFDPFVANRVYLGHFPGGFFVSNDGGRSWESSNIGLGNDGMFSLAVHPNHPEVLFAGTYNGIVRSIDGGRSWQDTSEGMPPEQWPFSVVIDDEHPELMYTATKNGASKGFCDRNRDTFCGTVMRSENGGATWSYITEDLPADAEYYMIVIDPRDHDVLYLSSSRGVYGSANRGDSWTLMNQGLPVEEFFIRDNVAHNMEMTPDGRSLVLTIVGYGVWRAELPEAVAD